jgi:hypothetical protein
MTEQNGLNEYFAFSASTLPDFNEVLNRKAKEGYRLQCYQVDNDGTYIRHYGVMYLSQTQQLQEAVNIVNIDKDKNTVDGTPLVAKMISEGWRILENYSKHVALIKLGEQKKKEHTINVLVPNIMIEKGGEHSE